jgi:hypothetical protein
MREGGAGCAPAAISHRATGCSPRRLCPIVNRLFSYWIPSPRIRLLGCAVTAVTPDGDAISQDSINRQLAITVFVSQSTQ